MEMGKPDYQLVEADLPKQDRQRHKNPLYENVLTTFQESGAKCVRVDAPMGSPKALYMGLKANIKRMGLPFQAAMRKGQIYLVREGKQ